MTKRRWIWLAIYAALTLVPGIALLAYAEAIYDGDRFSIAGRTLEHALGALLVVAWMLEAIVILRPALTALPLIAWTLLTAVPGFALLSSEHCSDEDEDFFGCIALDFSPWGEILVSAWLIGSVVMVATWALERDARPTAFEPCPRCGRSVAPGSPTCLACGYDFVRER